MNFVFLHVFSMHEMFRKIIHIALIAVLLVSTMGFSLSKHYCGTRLVDVKINTEAESCCGDGCKSNCCHNETLVFQLKEDFVGSVSLELNSPTQTDVLFPLDFLHVEIIAETIEDEIILRTESPPPKLLDTRLSEIQSYLL